MSEQSNKPWLAEYGDRIPHEIDAGSYASIVEVMLEASERFGDKQAFSNFGGGLSYRQVDALSRDFGAWLQKVAGVAKGDRVALMAPNMMVFPVAMLGIMRTGAVQVSVNPNYTARELVHQLTDADVDTIIVFAGSTPALGEVLDQTTVKHVVVAQLDDLVDKGLPAQPVDPRIADFASFGEALEAGSRLTLDAVEIGGEDPLFLQYTGGTTGPSKGAMLTHRNLIANVLQIEVMLGDKVNWGHEVVITAIPMYHIFALMVNTLAYYRFGSTNVLITNPRDMPGFVAEWAKWPVTFLTGVNTLFNGLLLTPGFSDIDFGQLKLAIGGGAAVQEAISARWKAVTGRHITQAYGLSETSPLVSMNLPERDEFNGTIGIPAPSTEITLRDDDCKVVAPGEAGELCVRGPQVMAGYWRKPEATAKAMTDDGYFRTGDVATIDQDGYLRIVDRKKDMVIVSGFNVYPNEIEAVAAFLPQVAECACIGVPDERTGEAVRLFVVKLDPELDAETIRAHCRKELAAYKVPRDVVFVEAIPKSTVGKILRRELRAD